MACPLRSSAFQLLKHTVTETQPLQKSSLHPNTPNSAPWQHKTAGFNPGSRLGGAGARTPSPLDKEFQGLGFK